MKGEVQIEARLRQLEGRALEGEAVVVPARGPAKYDSSKPDGGALASAPATYNTGADVAMDDAADKAEKKKKVCSLWVLTCVAAVARALARVSAGIDSVCGPTRQRGDGRCGAGRHACCVSRVPPVRSQIRCR